MKVGVYKVEVGQIGTVSDNGEELVIDGDAAFKRLITRLRRGKPAHEFVSSLPLRLRSYLYAQILEN